MTAATRPTAAFIGTRAEALEALRSEVDVTSILCLAGSRAHDPRLDGGLAVAVLESGDRYKARHHLNALRAGSTRQGITGHEISPQVDAGAIIAPEAIELTGLDLPEALGLPFGVVEPRLVIRALQAVLTGLCR